MLHLVIAALCALAILAPRSAGAEPSAELIAKARQEQEVVYYTELIVDQIVRPLARAFEQKYGIKVVFWRGDSQAVGLKLAIEHKAGRTSADVWSLASGLGPMIEGGLIEKFQVDNAAALPDELRDPAGYWVATNMIVVGLAANTNLVTPQIRPGSYRDLLAPHWRGKLVWKPNDMTGAWGFIGNMLRLMGEPDGLAFLRRLSAQQIAPVGAATRAILDQVVGGEYAMVLGVSNHNTEIVRKTGAPVAWLPLDTAWETLHAVGVTRSAPHPNAARLFVDFILSREGQEIFRNAGYIPARGDVPAATPALRPSEGGFKANLFAPQAIDRELERWSDIFNQVFR
jgi:ABC-type Fe3+ transport system substrate-binding protein